MRELLEQVERQRPCVHYMTNPVTANDVANAVLSVGGVPVMADYIEEVEDITVRSSALVLNMGMLSAEKLISMMVAGKAANRNGIPVILDPVGCMASKFRRDSVAKLLREVRFAVIKGNCSEMLGICGKKTKSKGVDAFEGADTGREERRVLAEKISKKYGCIAVITGEEDIVAKEESIYLLRNGDERMTRITGVGCMLSGLIGACVGANPGKEMEATLLACVMMGIAGQLARRSTEETGGGIGSMRIAMMDALSTMGGETVEKHIRLKEMSTLCRKLFFYGITPEYTETREYFAKLEQAMQGGITLLQLREKKLKGAELERLAVRVKSLCDRYGIPLIINDDPYMARTVGADGVHLGREDMKIEEARRLLGDKIIGLSAHNLEEALEAREAGADYIGVGAVFATSSKSGTHALSMEELVKITEGVDLPVVAIGGINGDNLPLLEGKNLDGVAVISAIFSSPDVKKCTRELKEKIRL
ncbi:MAG: hydroxyethylthiazole kinase [Filifactor alocis]|nr:hydroxyethylthiazole kinase [Filifactor alocis]